MINYFKKWKTEGDEDLKVPQDETIVFELKYKKLLVAILKLEKGIWSFRYSTEFKNQDLLKPLPDFPDLQKVYENKELYPFFLHRIPSTKQPKVQRVIKKNNIDATNEAALLKFFGLHSITNPFLLSPV